MRALLIGGAIAAVVASLAACGGSGSGSAARADTQRQADLYAIDQVEQTWHEAASKHNLDLMMSIWAPNASFTTAGKTYTGADQIRQFFATQAAPFKKENNWVSDTPAYKSRATVDGDKGTLHFECHFIDVGTSKVAAVTAGNLDVARIDGRWRITNFVGSTSQLTI